MTSELPIRVHWDVEASGSSGPLVMLIKKQTEVYRAVEDAEEKETILLTKENQQKGKLHMDPVVETSWPHKEDLALMEETISLVGKSTGMPETSSGVSHPRLLGLVK